MYLRVTVILIGLALLVFGLSDLVMPRARFVSSKPPAGAVLDAPPAAVIANFSNKLAPESTLHVTSTIKLLPSGETESLEASSLVKKSGIAPGDSGATSMRADLQPGLQPGLYWVTWSAKSARWGTVTYGKTYFSVGMSAPKDIIQDMDGPISERNYRGKSGRAAIIGGVGMIALGLLLWKLGK